MRRMSWPLYAGSRAPSQPGRYPPTDHSSIEDVSTPFVPSLRYDASIKALRVFNSFPASPGIDFRWGSLLSFCVYCLLGTPRLLATPRQYGDGRVVLAQSAIMSL